MRSIARTTLLSSALVLALSATASADVVTDWNEVGVDAIRAAGLGPNPATRILAIEHAAIHDAVVAITHTSTPYHYVPATAPDATASIDAAAVEAAYQTLVALLAAQKPALDAAYAESLARIPDGASKDAGKTVGAAAAQDLLALRTGDGSAPLSTPFTGENTAGKWQPTPPALLPGADPQWATLHPFVLTAPNQFRPVAPPDITSTDFATAYNEVQPLGSKTGSTRTADQTQIANFWVQATHVPVNEVARQLALRARFDVPTNARLFALVALAVADSRVAIWDAKYTYTYWRPITAIRSASYGNSGTTPIPTWEPLLTTPNHPEYPSGHSGTGAAGFGILRRIFGDDVTFTVASDSLPEVTRSFASLTAAVKENGRSRIYGGIHYTPSNLAGQAVGDQVASYVLTHALLPIAPVAQTDAGVDDGGKTTPPSSSGGCTVVPFGTRTSGLPGLFVGALVAAFLARRARRRLG